MFGSGANHGIHAQFIAATAAANGGKRVGLLRGAGTRMASWFYSMMRLLRLQKPLKATIHQQKFVDLTLNPAAKEAIKDIENLKFWKCLYILLRAVYPALRTLRYCDCSTPMMDKIYYLSHRTTEAIKKSQEFLDDEALFGEFKMDRTLSLVGVMVFGSNTGDDGVADVENSENSEDSSQSMVEDDVDEIEDRAASSDSEMEDEAMDVSMGLEVLSHWDKRKVRLEHEYAITGWALSVMAEVREDVKQRMSGIHRDAIEKVVKRLHHPPCPNKNFPSASMNVSQIVDLFWDEFKAFQNMTEPYHIPSRWGTPDVAQGRSYLWHEKYSLPYTKVLGFVACRVTSKLCGIGPAERSWGGVKHIKDGKRSHLTGASIEKRAILYISSKMQRARIEREKREQVDTAGPKALFGDDDINFDLQLEKFGVETDVLKEPAIERIFHAWVEQWEEDIRMKNDPVAEAMLLQKYKNLVFNDPDTKSTMAIWDANMEFRRGKGNGWVLIGCSADPDVEDEPFSLEMACKLIGQTKQADGVQVIRQVAAEEDSDNDE